MSDERMNGHAVFLVIANEGVGKLNLFCPTRCLRYLIVLEDGFHNSA
jgi:hypothetical protein